MLTLESAPFDGSHYGYTFPEGSLYDLDSCKQTPSFPHYLIDAEGPTDPVVNWLELQDLGYEAFDSGQLAPLQNVQVSYTHGPYPQLSLEAVYSLEGAPPAQSHLPLDNYSAQPCAPYGPCPPSGAVASPRSPRMRSSPWKARPWKCPTATRTRTCRQRGRPATRRAPGGS
ncbi:unnamed protein product [Natator depressus]